MKSIYDVIKKPIVTERSMENASAHRYTFAVDKNANKFEIKEAVEAIFGVKVAAVNTMEMMGDKKYTFLVHPEATKSQVKEAVEKMFAGTKVKSVNTMNYDGKEKRMGVHLGRRPAWKKAIVTLTAESKAIEFFESMI